MKTGYLLGVEGRAIDIWVRPQKTSGLTIEGLTDAAARETRVRVQAAIENSGLGMAGSVVTVGNPQMSRKDGTGHDLPIALALLGCDGAAVGELSLKGEIRPVRGILAIVEQLRVSGVKVVVVAPENQAEAELVPNIKIVSCRTLLGAKETLEKIQASPQVDRYQVLNPVSGLDMSDVRGQEVVKADLESVAISGENALLVGPVGAGKTMLARRFITILPGLTHEQALEATRIASAAGLNIGGGLVTQRPFRAPHHSTTVAGLVGGGTGNPRPGEMTLAHNGVLFLDEVAEFGRAILEAMREPVQTGEVVLARASGTLRFPGRCQILAGASPCPCGFSWIISASGTRCRCSPESIRRYQARIDEGCKNLGIKRRIEVQQVPLVDIEAGPTGEKSETIRARVEAAWAAKGRR